MSPEILIHATGLAALLLNVVALLLSCERSLRLHSGAAGALWALNNLLLGAPTAAALSLVSAGRTASSAATLDGGARRRLVVFIAFVVLTLGVSVWTWQGWPSALLTAASLVSTAAVFYLRGIALRGAMLAVSALWMVNAWQLASWEQMLANAATAAAALWGAWRTRNAQPCSSATVLSVEKP